MHKTHEANVAASHISVDFSFFRFFGKIEKEYIVTVCGVLQMPHHKGAK